VLTPAPPRLSLGYGRGLAAEGGRLARQDAGGTPTLR